MRVVIRPRRSGRLRPGSMSGRCVTARLSRSRPVCGADVRTKATPQLFPTQVRVRWRRRSHPPFLADGSYRKHLASLRSRLVKRKREVAAMLAPLGIRRWIERVGFYLWCRLSDERGAARVARFAVGGNAVLAAGDVFSIAQTARGWMRFNVARMADPRLLSVMRTALQPAKYRSIHARHCPCMVESGQANFQISPSHAGDANG